MPPLAAVSTWIDVVRVQSGPNNESNPNPNHQNVNPTYT